MTRFVKYDYNGKIWEHAMGAACSTKGKKRNVYRLMVVKPEGKRPLG
jgi:hypothetical protein